MEIFEAKKITDETVTGVKDDPPTILKPGVEKTVGDDFGSVVVKTTFVEKTEVYVAKMIREDKDDEFMKDQEQVEGVKVNVDEKEGAYVNLVDLDDDDNNDNDDDGDSMNVNCSENGAFQAMDVDGSLAGENVSIVNLLFEDNVADENDENGNKIFEPKDDTNKNGKENIEIREDIVGELAENKEKFNLEQGENTSGVNLVFEGITGFLSDEHDGNASGDPMDISLSVEKETNKNGEGNVEIKGNIASQLAENQEEFNGEQGERKEEEDHGFVVGDLVWGRIKGHTWWPGQIYNPSDASDNAARSIHKGRLLVAYFGDGSYSWCSPSQLKPFIDHFPEMLNQSDSKKSVSAVQMALKEVSRLVEGGLMCKCQTVNRVDSSRVLNRGIKKGVVVPKGNTIKVLMDRIEPVELLLVLKTSATMDTGARIDELELTLLKSCLNVFNRKKDGYLLEEYYYPKCIDGLEDKTRSGVRDDDDSDINRPSGSIDNGDDKLFQRRKQKSVAELLREEEPKMKNRKTTKNGGLGKRKKELLVSVTESDHESGGGGGVEDETMSPRQRKKSKYLSPPYLSPTVGGKLLVSGSGSFKEPKPEPKGVPEMDAKQLNDSLKSSGKKTRQRRGAHDLSDSQEEQKKTVDAAVNVNKVLQVLLRVSLDPTSVVDKNVPEVTDFILSHRSTAFGEASSYQADQKKKARDTPDLAFIKQKLESMIEIVRRCEQSEMRADVKASLDGGMREVLQKVGKMKGN